MLRINCLQQWYGLSDSGAEDAIKDRLSFQRFLRLDPFIDTVPFQMRQPFSIFAICSKSMICRKPSLQPSMGICNSILQFLAFDEGRFLWTAEPVYYCDSCTKPGEVQSTSQQQAGNVTWPLNTSPSSVACVDPFTFCCHRISRRLE